MDAIFHFGMTKTGSTSIQAALARMPLDARKDFAYFQADGKVNSNQFIEVLYKSRKRPKRKRGDPGGKQERFRDLLNADASNAPANRWLFSSESLMYKTQDVIVDLRSPFAEAGHNARAVGYIRPPKSFIESAFQERAKRLRMGSSLEKWLGTLYPDYRESFEKFDLVFGRDAVEFWLFAPKTFTNGCVVQDFAGRVGIEIPEQYVTRSNDSMSRPAVSLLYAVRKFGEKVGREGNIRGRIALVRKLRSLEGGKLRFHSSLIAPVLEKNRDDIAWMEDRLGASLRENLEADDAIAIKSEGELLDFESATLQWLSKELGDTPLARDVMSGDPELIAKGVQEVAVAAGKARRAAGAEEREGKRVRA